MNPTVTLLLVLVLLPIVTLLATRLGVRQETSVLTRSLMALRDEMVAARTEAKMDSERNWNFIRTVNQNVLKLDERVRALENEWSDGK